MSSLKIAAAVLASLAACQDAPARPPQEFDGARALGYASAQVAFGPRVPNTEGHRR